MFSLQWLCSEMCIFPPWRKKQQITWCHIPEHSKCFSQYLKIVPTFIWRGWGKLVKSLFTRSSGPTKTWTVFLLIITQKVSPWPNLFGAVAPMSLKSIITMCRTEQVLPASGCRHIVSLRRWTYTTVKCVFVVQASKHCMTTKRNVCSPPGPVLHSF